MRREKRELYRQKRELYRYKRRLYRQKRRLYKQTHRRTSLWQALSVYLLSAALLFVLAVGAVNAVVIGTTTGNIRDFSAEEGYTVAVVFGAKVHEGGTLSHMLSDRMDAAIELYRSGKVQKILVSGDGRGQWSETKYMRLYAVANGVAAKDVIEDGEGYSTIETVTRAKEVFGIEKCVLVTQKYHLYRAIYASESLGMDVVGVNSDPRTYYGQLYRDIREILARVKDFAICIAN
jgi:vancomycin permeability regulator SanA